MSLFQSRPTLVDSDCELSACVEPDQDEGTVVFLRMREGDGSSLVIRVRAMDFTMFSLAIAELATTFQKPLPIKEKKAGKNKNEWIGDL